MIHLLWPSNKGYEPRDPVTLLVGEIEEYDFSDAADQIYHILSVLQLCDLIEEVPITRRKMFLMRFKTLLMILILAPMSYKFPNPNTYE